MYFWDISALKEDLINNNWSEQADFKYLLALIVSYLLASFPFETSNIYDTYAWLVGLVFTIVGTVVCFKKNEANDGQHFIRRYISISWVMTIKMIVFLMPSMLFLLIFLKAFGLNFIEESTIFDVGVVAVISAIFFWRVYIHIENLGAKTV